MAGPDDNVGRDPKYGHEVVQKVLDLVQSGKVDSILYDTLYDGLDNVKQGLLDLEGRKTWGKAVVRVRKEDEARAKL